MDFKKIAIPIDKNDNLDSHFGHTKLIKIYKIRDHKIISESYAKPPPHEPGMLPAWIARKAVSDVITGGIGDEAKALLDSYKINVFNGAPSIQSQELIEQFITNTLVLSEDPCAHKE